MFLIMKGIILLVLLNNLCACKSVNGDDIDINDNSTNNNSINKDSWLSRMRAMRSDVKDCVKKSSSGSTWNCLKVTSLKLIDEILSSSVIPLWRGIRLVQVAGYIDDRTTDPSEQSGDGDFGVGVDAQRDSESFVYLDQIVKRMTRVLQTHALQVSFKEIVDGFMLDDKDKSTYGTPRHRRHRNNMMIAMIFGVTALGAIMVPVGFQVLSVVSGKALLLAKMALLLASINGLKKIANSGVHYGLYHVPHEPFGYHHHGYYDRGDAQHPRNVPNLLDNRVEDVL